MCDDTPDSPPPQLPPVIPSTPNDCFDVWCIVKPPPDLTPEGLSAWNGLQTVQAMNGWWGNELDAREALILLINHEIAYEIYNTPARDVIINQYNLYCANGPWSASCLNSFWGYSIKIKNASVCCTGGERLPPTNEFVAALADGVLNHTITAQNKALIHYGNALVDSTAQTLSQLYSAGNRTYASYLTVTYCNGTTPCDGTITGVFVVQTFAQNQCTGPLQDWIFSSCN